MKALFLITTQGLPPLKDKKKWSGSMKNFLSCCTCQDPNKRPLAIEMLQVIIFLLKLISIIYILA